MTQSHRSPRHDPHVQTKKLPHEVERGAEKGVRWAGRLLFGIVIGSGLVSAARTSVFLVRSTATTGHVVGRYDKTTPYPVDSKYRGITTLEVRSSYVQIEYIDRLGQQQFAVAPEYSLWRANEERLPVRYDASNPPHVRVCTPYGLWSAAVLLVAVGVIGWGILELVWR